MSTYSYVDERDVTAGRAVRGQLPQPITQFDRARSSRLLKTPPTRLRQGFGEAAPVTSDPVTSDSDPCPRLWKTGTSPYTHAVTRVRAANNRPLAPAGRYVLYWMTSFRRLRSNFALEQAVGHARELNRPLVILEALRCDYRWASDRLHRFVIDGMAEHARALAGTRVRYVPYVEPSRGAGKGFLAALAADACVVVTDDYPCFFLPRMIAAAGKSLNVRLEAVDSNGLLPIRATDRPFSTAHAFRAYVQRTLRSHLAHWPAEIDFADLPKPPSLTAVTQRWRSTPLSALAHPKSLLARLPIDHSVAPVQSATGGEIAAASALERFVRHRLARYADDQRHPDADATSHLSPYLHSGHSSAHDIFAAVMKAERWTTRRLATTSRGARDGWWGVRAGANAFLDQLVTWRELGFNLCVTRPDDYKSLDALPTWARATLDRHRRDRRRYTYTRDELADARTHDDIWNAAQRQLVRDGWMHNYLRMLWGKKILEWSRSPAAALETMIDLMNRYALDGRDPNSYSGYLWTLGLFDRPWGPEREIFGTVRYMSSDNTRRKLRLSGYLAKYR